MPEKFPGNALNLACKLLQKLNRIQREIDSSAILKLKSAPGTVESKPLQVEDLKIVKTACPFFYKASDKNNTEINLVSSQITWENPLSVRDFSLTGKINSTCPYYLMKDRLPESDVCVLPYNYVLDPDLRAQINLDLKDAVVIFDEGHNIVAQCEELFQFEIAVPDLFAAFKVMDQIWKELQAEEQFLNEY